MANGTSTSESSSQEKNALDPVEIEKFTDNHPQNPLYLHPSDTPAKNKIGFVDGPCRKDHYKELANGLMFSYDAHSVWKDLKERFDKQNLTRIYQVHREISTMSQGVFTVSEYYSKLRNLWDEYVSIVPLPTCECDKYRVYAEHMERLKLMQFLMGLNDSFAQSRSQVLLTIPSPSRNQVYSMIIQDESQKVQSSLISNCVLPLQKLDVHDHTALASLHNNRVSQNTRLYCDYCHLRNHTRANCYRLIGYPPNFKFTRKKGVDDRGGRGQSCGNRRPQANNVNHASNQDENGPPPYPVQTVPFFTHDQYNYLLKMIDMESAPKEAMANMAGIIGTPSTFNISHVCSVVGDDTFPWIVDTWATHHMASSLDRLPNLIHAHPSFISISLPNGHTTSVTHTGSAKFLHKHEISNALYDLCTGKVRGIGKEKEGFYILPHTTTHPPLTNASHLSSSNSSINPASFSSNSSSRSSHTPTITTGHLRVGHPPAAVLQKIDSLKSVFQHQH
ncbi:hypothetical protein KY289_030264 [Solanum tuberosum]|nr:hypothetical protein KY289_030264 [Solanum tuberosum]